MATLLIASPKVRQTGFSVRALNVELAQVLDATSSPTTASARFAFWSDVVEHLFSPHPSQRYDGNPLVRDLQMVRLLFVTHSLTLALTLDHATERRMSVQATLPEASGYESIAKVHVQLPV